MKDLIIHRLGLCKPFHNRRKNNHPKGWCPLLQDYYDKRFKAEEKDVTPLAPIEQGDK